MLIYDANQKWMFPKIVVPPNHPMFNRVFHYKSSILEHLYFWKHPYHDHLIAKTPRFLSAFCLPGLSVWYLEDPKTNRRVAAAADLEGQPWSSVFSRPQKEMHHLPTINFKKEMILVFGGSTLPFKQNRIMVWWLYGQRKVVLVEYHFEF